MTATKSLAKGFETLAAFEADLVAILRNAEHAQNFASTSNSHSSPGRNVVFYYDGKSCALVEVKAVPPAWKKGGLLKLGPGPEHDYKSIEEHMEQLKELLAVTLADPNLGLPRQGLAVFIVVYTDGGCEVGVSRQAASHAVNGMVV